MAAGVQNLGGLSHHHLERKLAAVVRSIRWSYAIFWSISTRNQGMLEWGDGYYNGQIKTRKTVQSVEICINEIDLQRSNQLRDLFKSLSAGDAIQQGKQSSAALSPEDLTDAEWYYLVCMSFTFKHGQGMPGRALVSGRHIWLCNSNYADSKVFTRSLLAKSASIQTVVCIPLMGGVLEMGVTELISEDPSLLQHVKTCLSELPKPVCSEHSTSSPRKADKVKECLCTGLDHGLVNGMPLDKSKSMADYEMLSEPCEFPMRVTSYAPEEKIGLSSERIEPPVNTSGELKMESSGDTSNGFGDNHDNDDSFMMDDLNSISPSQYINDEFSNGLHSVNSSNCTSESVINPEKVISSPNGEKASNFPPQDLQECNHKKLCLLDLETQGSHYANILAAIFQNSQRSTSKPYFWSDSSQSNFMAWRKGLDTRKLLIVSKQKMLKKVLIDGHWMRGSCLPKFQEAVASKGRVWKTEESDIGVNHASSARRSDKMDEKLLTLRSMVPSISKVDKPSILGETIQYVKELKKRVEELEACREFAESGARERKKHHDVVERTSDNYGHNETTGERKPSIHKRKASDIDETDAELYWLLSKDSLADMTVTVIEKEVLIEIRCPWRECLLLEIVEAISGLNLDAHSVNSSTTDGILTLTLTSKCRGATVASVGMIKHTLQKVVGLGLAHTKS